MSFNGVRKRRSRGAARDPLVESTTSKKSKTKGQHADVTENSGFQIIGAKLDEIVKRLDTLERDRSSSMTASSGSTISGSQIDQIIPRVNSVITGSSLQSVTSGSGSEVTYLIRPTVDKPIFSGRNDANPMKFLNKLHRYINSINGQNRALEIATDCLTGSALKILELFSDNWQSIVDFERDFQKTFWGNTHQERAKYQLVNSSWDSKSQLTMSEHFAEQIDKVRYVTIPLSECEVVNSIMRHYPIDIQRLWFTRNGVVTKLTAAEFLRDVEQNMCIRLDERPVGSSSRFSERGGRGNLSCVNFMNAWSRDKGSYRGRGQRRGWYNYRGNRGRTLPAIRFERASNATTNTRGTPPSNKPDAQLAGK